MKRGREEATVVTHVWHTLKHARAHTHTGPHPHPRPCWQGGTALAAGAFCSVPSHLCSCCKLWEELLLLQAELFPGYLVRWNQFESTPPGFRPLGKVSAHLYKGKWQPFCHLQHHCKLGCCQYYWFQCFYRLEMPLHIILSVACPRDFVPRSSLSSWMHRQSRRPTSFPCSRRCVLLDWLHPTAIPLGAVFSQLRSNRPATH